MSEYYVYVYFRLNGEPCYIGKGKEDRWLVHEKRCTNKRLWRIIQKSGGELPKVIIRDCLTNDEAKEIEKAFIKALGRLDLGTGPLVNLTDGGEGENPSEAQREAIRKARTGCTTSAEARAKQREAKINDPENTIRLEKARAAIGPETDERRMNRKLGQERRWKDNDAERSHYRQKLTGREQTPEHKANQKAAIAARPVEAENARRAKIAAAASAQWAAYRAAKEAA